MGKKIASLKGDSDYKAFICPGCKSSHHIPTGEAPNAWGWNRSYENPTFTPSILVNGNPSFHNPTAPRCHSYVTDGKIQFLSDCTHHLSGQTIPMEDIPESWE